jgi:hypothetical protein
MSAGLNTQSARAPLSERGNDLYETPAVATEALLRVEKLPHVLWEPCCGPGSIVTTLRDAGHFVIAGDLVDYGCPLSTPRIDFLMERRAPHGVECIVTNPPFKNAEAFVERAKELCPKVVMLLRLAFLESERRRGILDDGTLARVHVFRNRLPMMHRAGQGIIHAEKQSSSALAFAWFVWDRNHSGPTEMHRLSWAGT